MARHALLLLIAVLAAGEAPASQRFERPVILRTDPAVADCRNGQLERYPRYLANGMQLSLVFRGPITPEADGRILDALRTDFQVTNPIINDSSVIFLIAKAQPASREAIDRLIRQACQIEQLPGYRVTGAQTTDAREIQRTDAAVAAERLAVARANRRMERRRVAAERRIHREWLRSPPTPDELTALLRNKWEEVIANSPRNPVTEGKYNRVRDVSCKRRQGIFHCLVGVLGTSERGPEYEQLELEFIRADDGSVALRELEVIIT